MQSIQNQGQITFMQAPEVKMEELNNLFFENNPKKMHHKMKQMFYKIKPV